MDKPRKLADPVHRVPFGVRLARILEAVSPGFLALYAFAAGLLASAQLFATTERRVIASLVWVLLFVTFWVYLCRREPSWFGPGGITQKITRPKLKHWLFLVGVLVFTWAPAVRWLMPSSQLEQATALEIQRQVSALEEKTRVADLLYSRMIDDEDETERYSKSPELQLLLPPPKPYAGLAERLEADLPRFSVTVPQRTVELEVAGGRFKSRARIYRRLQGVEDQEREVIVGFRMWTESYAKEGQWTTPIGAYRRVFRYLIIGVYLRTLQDLEPDLRSIGLSPPAIPHDLAAAKGPVSEADQKRLDLGLPPTLEKSDFVPAEIHYVPPKFR